MILTTFIRLLKTREIEFQEESGIEVALSLYADNTADSCGILEGNQDINAEGHYPFKYTQKLQVIVKEPVQ